MYAWGRRGGRTSEAPPAVAIVSQRLLPHCAVVTELVVVRGVEAVALQHSAHGLPDVRGCPLQGAARALESTYEVKGAIKCWGDLCFVHLSSSELGQTGTIRLQILCR